MPRLKNIIFDLGAVLIDVDYHKTANAFKNLGVTNFDEMYSQFAANPIFQQLEMGLITEDEFYQDFNASIEKPLTVAQINFAWNEILLDWRKASVLFLGEINQHYNIYLLSNTNIIHQKAFFKTLQKEVDLPTINHFFKKAYYSHEVHLRKPNADIFEFVLQDAGIVAAETLFIDDSYNNIDTANTLGFKTHLLLQNERIEHLEYNNFN
jgi:glucose-1-phosphatase